MPDERLAAGPPWRSKEEIGDLPLQTFVGRDANRVLHTTVLKCLVDLTPSSLANWVRHARADRTKGRTGLTTEERAELAQLRKENRELRTEREILKNHLGAAADL